MYCKTKRQRRKHGPLLYVVIGYKKYLPGGHIKYCDEFYIASIRQSDLDDRRAMFEFWDRVWGKLYSSFTPDECKKFFEIIGRKIPRPRRLVCTDDGIYFLLHDFVTPHMKRRKS